LTLREALRRATARLTQAGIEDPALEAEVLLRHALALDRTQLYQRLSDELPPEPDSTYRALLERRLRREPTAYITGRKEFYCLELELTPVAAIPRPETELLVEETLALARRPGHEAPLTVVDVGTGCGAVALALAAGLPHAEVIATDSSSAALDLARRNARRLGLTSRVRFLQGDLLSPLEEHVDLVAANLPYCRTGDWESLAPEVRCYEPRQALDGGPDGLRLIERLLRQAPAHLQPGGAVLLEIGYDQGEAARLAAREAFSQATIEVKQDLAGLDRLVIIKT
jgi:release factor glutamine methyltransferase